MSDSITCIPNRQHRIAIEMIERGKAAKVELDSTKAYLGRVLKSRDSLMGIAGSLQKAYVDLSNNYDLMVTNLTDQKNLESLRVKSLSDELRKQKRKSRLILMGVFLANGLTTFFLLKN